jgi:hypothetical protein
MREAQGSCLNETDGGFQRSSHGIDTRLIAAVERAAAAQSHRAAGLLNGYRLWGAVLERARRAGSEALAEEAEREFLAAKVRLRRFLSEGLTAVPPSWRQNSPDRLRRLFGDRPAA